MLDGTTEHYVHYGVSSSANVLVSAGRPRILYDYNHYVPNLYMYMWYCIRDRDDDLVLWVSEPLSPSAPPPDD